MKLADVIDAYLTRQRSLGMRFESAGRLLRRFSRAMGDRQIQEVTPEAVIDFLNGNGALSRDMGAQVQGLDWLVQVRLQPWIRGSLASAGRLCRSCRRSKRPTSIPPKNSADCWKRRRPCAPATAGKCQRCTVLCFLLLYGSGMRIGEALRLTLQDVDLTEQVITVRDTKFFKTRLVPIGPKLTRELAAHIERRRLLPLPHGEASPLFTYA